MYVKIVCKTLVHFIHAQVRLNNNFLRAVEVMLGTVIIKAMYKLYE